MSKKERKSGFRSSLNFKTRRATVATKDLGESKSLGSVEADFLAGLRQSGSGRFGISRTTFSSSKIHVNPLAAHCKRSMLLICDALGLESHQKDDLFAALDSVITDEQHQELQSRRISPLLPPSVKALKLVVEETSLFLRYQNHIREVVIVQSLWRGKQTRRWFNRHCRDRADVRRMKIRNRAFMTLIAAERDYQKVLNTVLEAYLKPLRNNALKSVGVDKIADIFQNIEILQNEHCQLLTNLESLFLLESSANTWPFITNIGHCLLEASKTLLPQYGVYTENAYMQTATLEELTEQDAAFKQFLADANANMDKPLAMLLQKPLDHIGNRVRPALVHICEHSRDYDEGHEELESALQVIVKTSEYILKAVDEGPHCAKLVKCIRRIQCDHPLNLKVSKAVDLVREGPIAKADSLKNAYVMLFTDVLIIGEAINHDHYTMRCTRTVELNAKMSIDMEVSGDKKAGKTLTLRTPDGPINLLFKNANDKLSWQAELLLVLDKFKAKVVFGMDLNKLLQAEGRVGGVPRCVESLFAFLRASNRLQAEGIFRVAGKKVTIDKLKEQYDSGKGDEIEWDGLEVHSAACLLKLWFREMPTPLFPFECFRALVDLQTEIDESAEPPAGSPGHFRNVARIADVLTAMNDSERVLFKELLQFLREVTAQSDMNKMHSKNLAVVFAPNLLRPERDTVETALLSPQITNIVKSIIDNHELVFSLLHDDAQRRKYMNAKVATVQKQPTKRSLAPLAVAAIAAVPPPIATPPGAAVRPIAVPPPAAVPPPVAAPPRRLLPSASDSDLHRAVGRGSGFAGAPPPKVAPPAVIASARGRVRGRGGARGVERGGHHRTGSMPVTMMPPPKVPPPEALAAAAKEVKRCKARYAYQGQTAKDLTLEKGDVIKILEQKGDWWLGELEDGRQGLFPSNYVRMLRPRSHVLQSSAGQEAST